MLDQEEIGIYLPEKSFNQSSTGSEVGAGIPDFQKTNQETDSLPKMTLADPTETKVFVSQEGLKFINDQLEEQKEKSLQLLRDKKRQIQMAEELAEKEQENLRVQNESTLRRTIAGRRRKNVDMSPMTRRSKAPKSPLKSEVSSQKESCIDGPSKPTGYRAFNFNSRKQSQNQIPCLGQFSALVNGRAGESPQDTSRRTSRVMPNFQSPFKTLDFGITPMARARPYFLTKHNNSEGSENTSRAGKRSLQNLNLVKDSLSTLKSGNEFVSQRAMNIENKLKAQEKLTKIKDRLNKMMNESENIKPIDLVNQKALMVSCPQNCPSEGYVNELKEIQHLRRIRKLNTKTNEEFLRLKEAAEVAYKKKIRERASPGTILVETNDLNDTFNNKFEKLSISKHVPQMVLQKRPGPAPHPHESDLLQHVKDRDSSSLLPGLSQALIEDQRTQFKNRLTHRRGGSSPAQMNGMAGNSREYFPRSTSIAVNLVEKPCPVQIKSHAPIISKFSSSRKTQNLFQDGFQGKKPSYKSYSHTRLHSLKEMKDVKDVLNLRKQGLVFYRDLPEGEQTEMNRVSPQKSERPRKDSLGSSNLGGSRARLEKLEGINTASHRLYSPVKLQSPHISQMSNRNIFSLILSQNEKRGSFQPSSDVLSQASISPPPPPGTSKFGRLALFPQALNQDNASDSRAPSSNLST